MTDRSDLPDTGQFTSDLADVQLHDAGWIRLPSGVDITRMPLWDDRSQIFARLGWQAVQDWMVARGWSLPTVEQLDELHDISHHIEPVCKVRGGHAAEDRLHMSSLRWCVEHDDEVFARLAQLEEPWTDEPVANAGKHWCLPLGGIYGWWRAAAPMIQRLSMAHGTQPRHTDYATTVHAVRPGSPVDGPSPTADTDPAPASGVAPAVTSAGPDPSTWRTLRRGMRGPDVVAWQGVVAVEADGDYGPTTEAATRRWQAKHELVADGIVGPRTRAAIGTPPVPRPEPSPPPAAAPVGEVPASTWLADIKWVPAKNYSSGHKARDWIVLHSTEGPIYDSAGRLRGYVALGVAYWFGGRDWRGRPVTAPQASSHYVVGADQDPGIGVIQCVHEEDSAWTAGVRLVNLRSINIEIVGQTMTTDWADEHPDPADEQVLLTLQRAAAISRRSCDRWDIPWREVSDAELDEAHDLLVRNPDAVLPDHCRGLISHADVTRAWGVRGGHQDPGGPGDRRWPWERFLAMG